MATVRDAKIAELTPDPHNANAGTERGRYLLDHSLRQYGAARSVVLDKHGVVIAGNKTVEAAADIGLEDVVIVHTTGDQLVAVQRDDLDLEDGDRARLLAYADNRSSEVGLAWEPEALQFDLDAGLDLSGMFRGEELQLILAEALPDDLLGVEKDAKPNPRRLPIDVIYTLQMADCTCCLAVQAGLLYGIQSASYRLCPYVGQLSGRHRVAFIDNDYFNYNHSVHLEAVKALRPKYATVRDYMSKAQCAAAEIAFYDLEQVLDWAEELAEYAENIIVIPKVDVLDQVPAKYVLGYSVPTSHGGTPLPVEAFRGRRVHLLGGSWKAQLAHMAQLGDDVVSLDTNYVQRQARMLGAACDPDGDEFQMKERGYAYLTNVRYAALALSFGAIGAKVNELYKDVAPPKRAGPIEAARACQGNPDA